MSTHAATDSAGFPVASTAAGAKKALVIGVAGIVLTVAGCFVSGVHGVAMSWLVGVVYWTAMAIGMLMLILIHHIFDASWSVVLRRQFEHGLASFKWLALLFAPLVIASIIGSHDIVWPWMNPAHELHGGHSVGHDPLYLKKASFLNLNMFVGMTILFFAIWVWLSARLRKASFRQDADGDVKWTLMNRRTAAFGLPLGALTLTFAAIFWIKSLEYHWFSTMYGVWFFSNCVRGGLSLGVLIMLWLWCRGDYKGILNTNHWHSIGQLMLAFTVFWAYVAFSQYFLIWNANLPEETFWYNLREINADGSPNQWKYVGIIGILFGHFVVPFLFLLSYRYKVTHSKMRFIAIWILAVIFLDMCYNILPALKDAHGNSLPLFSLHLIWVISATVGIGGICVWAYLRSFSRTKLIPICDPRIKECLTFHE